MKLFKFKFALIVAGSVFSSASLSASSSLPMSSDFTGNFFYPYCEKETPDLKYGWFTGYLYGFTNGIAMQTLYSKSKPITCVVDTSWTTKQLFDVVCKRLKEFPEERGDDIDIIVGAALIRAFPCK